MSAGERLLNADPGSFRDPDSRVFLDGPRVLRALSDRGLEDFTELAASGLLDDPRIVRTTLSESTPLPALGDHGAAAVLEHERVPFISYPYEWSFSMLKQAALLQLDLILLALDHDLMLKDSSPYNVQFFGERAVFIDIGSFERLREDELWVGHRQFCQLYLFPLLLQSHKGIDVQPWLRGSLDGIPVGQMRALMSARDRFRRGYLTNVFLHARLERSTARRGATTTARSRRPGVGKAVIAANVRAMRRVVARLDWRSASGVWTEYGEHNSYSASDAAAKDSFVRDVAALGPRELVWDLGCNNGRHSRLTAQHARSVVAVDSDHATVDRLYRELCAEPGEGNILPLVIDLADPSPSQGWRTSERRSLDERGQPDLVLALALVHHLVIAANIPMRGVVAWFASMQAELIVEFPSREDPMVQRLLAPKRAGLHADYDRTNFETLLGEAFEIRRTDELGGGTRTLYHAVPLTSSGQRRSVRTSQGDST